MRASSALAASRGAKRAAQSTANVEVADLQMRTATAGLVPQVGGEERPASKQS